MKLTSTMRLKRLGTIPLNPKMPKFMDNDDNDMENTIVEYNSNYVFGDIK
jgi:hypothetical protein